VPAVSSFVPGYGKSTFPAGRGPHLVDVQRTLGPPGLRVKRA